MKIQALAALLVSGVVSIASAAPQETAPAGRTSYTKEDSPPSAPAAWVELASPTPCVHGRSFVTIESDAVPVTKIRISAEKGRPVIKAVRIVFTDGTKRYVKLDRTLDARNPAYIDLRGNKQIEMMVVDTDWRVKGSYAIHGAPNHKSVAFR